MDIRELSAEEKKAVAAQISLYKSWRDTMQFGTFYRGRSGNLHEWCCVSGDRSRAVGMLLQELVRPNTQSERFFARGLSEDAVYRFYNIPEEINIQRFGTLVNLISPVHVRQNSMVHDMIAKVVKLQGETEDVLVSGQALMCSGVKLRQGFAGVGFDDRVRLFQDFDSRLYFMEKTDETGSE